MGKIHIDFESSVLKKQMQISVIAPIENNDLLSSARVMYLLHGLGNTELEFINKTDIEVMAKKYNLIVITPFAERGFYCNVKTGMNYFDYTKDEVFEVVNNALNVDIKLLPTYIMGVSMGGYGAFKLGLANPERYVGIGSISGSLDIMKRDLEKRANNDEVAQEWEMLFGETMDITNDLYQYVDVNITNKIYICCGDKDYLKPYNDHFVENLNQLGVKNKYVVSEGSHNFEYFTPHINKCIEYLMGDNDE
jgi:putative tributyrin esterase